MKESEGGSGGDPTTSALADCWTKSSTKAAPSGIEKATTALSTRHVPSIQLG